MLTTIDFPVYRLCRPCPPPQATLTIIDLASLLLHQQNPVMHDTLPKPSPFLRKATKFLHLWRKSPSPSTVMRETPSASPNPQWQSLFFATLPPEVRILIYHELARDAPSVVHVMKKSPKQIDFVRCGVGKCEMEYNFKCCSNPSASGGTISLAPFLLSCRKGYAPPSSQLI